MLCYDDNQILGLFCYDDIQILEFEKLRDEMKAHGPWHRDTYVCSSRHTSQTVEIDSWANESVIESFKCYRLQQQRYIVPQPVDWYKAIMEAILKIAKV